LIHKNCLSNFLKLSLENECNQKYEEKNSTFGDRVIALILSGQILRAVEECVNE